MASLEARENYILQIKHPRITAVELSLIDGYRWKGTPELTQTNTLKHYLGLWFGTYNTKASCDYT